MINLSSQLVSPAGEEGATGASGTIDGNAGGPTRRLMHMKLFKQIADRFHGDIKIAQGVPYSIAALEDFIAIGSSDGSVRLFDQNEQEIKTLMDKSTKQNAVTCLDFKRIGPQKHIYVASGHIKGQVALYEIKGLLQQEELQARQNQVDAFTALEKDIFGNVSFKHKKTVDDIHATTVVSIKFVGDFRNELSVISSDLRGVVYMSTFDCGRLFCSVNKKCLWTKRLGAAYSLAPLISIGSNANLAYLEVMERLDRTVYKSQKEQKAVAGRLQDVGPSIVGFGSLEEIYVA
jgi:hypothetical protein